MDFKNIPREFEKSIRKAITIPWKIKQSMFNHGHMAEKMMNSIVAQRLTFS